MRPNHVCTTVREIPICCLDENGNNNYKLKYSYLEVPLFVCEQCNCIFCAVIIQHPFIVTNQHTVCGGAITTAVGQLL